MANVAASNPAPGPTRPDRRLPPWAMAIAVVCASVGLLAAGALAWQHLTGSALPGCGGVSGATTGTTLDPDAAPKSACATLEAHYLGSLGGMRVAIESVRAGNPIPKIAPAQAFWPTSFLGAAYFAAVLSGLVVVALLGRRISGPTRVLIVLGTLTSAAYLAVIIIDKKFCQYCIASHIANLLVLASVEIGLMTSRSRVAPSNAPSARIPASKRGAWIPLVAGVAALAGTSVALGVMEAERAERLHAAADAALEDSMSELQAKIAADQTAAAQPAAADAWPAGFKARWTKGPDSAPVRIVLISSYQCPDCKRVEGEAFQLIDKYKDQISLGAMHFPLDSNCNKYVKGTSPHPNACWAARAAETAGMLQGADGFWKMHKWLFEKNGSFTNQEIRDGVKSLGFDDATFLTIMQSEAPLRLVQQDIDVGEKLGLYFTPMVFINGIELRGWAVPGALISAVDNLMKQPPPALTAAVDKPVLADRKYIDDWKVSAVRQIAPARAERTRGEPNAPVQITIFGDYTEPNTATANQALAAWLTSDKAKNVQISWRHFPGDQSCNPSLPRTFFPSGCIAARAAEAAGAVGGAEAYWKMHDWLFNVKDKTTITVDEIKRGATSLGIDAGKLEAAMDSEPVKRAIDMDIAAARAAGVTQIPAIYVNGRFVQRWIRDNDDVMGRIYAEALAEKK